LVQESGLDQDVKARFLDSQALDPKSQTVLLTTADEQTYVENFSFLGAVAAKSVNYGGLTAVYRTIEMPESTSLLVYVVFCAKKVKWRKSVP
jgi:hypothetical protein